MYPFADFHLPGFHQVAPNAWINEERIVVQPFFFDLPPDLPAALTDLTALRRGLAGAAAAQGGTLIEADTQPLGGQPALRQVVKMRLPNQPHGQVFLGSYIVPKATCSAVLRIQAAEMDQAGFREAVVAAQIGPTNFFRPHPYGPEGEGGGLPSHAADDPAYDAQFPQHPLTRVRQVLAQLTDLVTWQPDFAAAAPFAP